MVGSASAWRLLKRPGEDESRTALRMAIGMVLVVAPLQLLIGDAAGKQVGEVQPSKLAAIEAFWDTKGHQAFNVVAWPDRRVQANRFALSIPELGSWITHGRADAVVPGLKDLGANNQPPVAVVFWAFRVMVGLGMLMILQGVCGAVLCLRGGLERTRLFLWFSHRDGPRPASSPWWPAGPPPRSGANPMWSTACCAPPTRSRRWAWDRSRCRCWAS